MNNNDGKIWYGVGIDTTDIQRDSKKVNDAFKGIGDKAQAEGSRIENSFSRAGGMLTGILSATAIAGFAKKMFEVRSEFQDAESSMRIFLGSAEKASTFMKELQDYAWYNMFEFKDLTGESAKLLAFGNAVQDVIPIIDQLSNIASGTQGSLSELVNIYNKAKSIGKVDSQMLESLGSRGVVVTDVLKQMGVQVDRSAIKFEHLKMVLEHLTGEGGMFHGLMAEQMENLSASAGQLQDNIAIMLNEIGEKSQDALKAGIDSASYLVDNYERVGRIVAELILTYGAYKTAVLVLTTVQRVQRLVQLELVSSSKAVTAWQGIQAVSVKSLTGAWASLNKTMAANQFALIGMAIAAIGYGLYKLITYQTDAEIQQSKLNNTFKDASKLIAAETVQIDTLFARLKSAKKGTEDYDTAKKAIFSKYGEYLKHLGDEHTALNNIDAAYKAITESATKAARAKGLAMATEQASADLVDKQAEVLEDIKKQLDQKFGKDSKKSLEIFYQLKPIVESGKGIDSVKKDFLSLFDKTLTVQSSSFGTYTSYTTNKLKELINTGSKAMQTFDDINKRAELLYGETALKTQTKTPPVKTIVVELTPEQKKAIEDRKKLLAEISKGDLEQLRWNEEFSFQKQEAEISLWEDGTAKELALIELSYRRKILAINRQEEDLLRVIQEQAQKRAKAEGNASFDKSTVELDPEQRDLFEMLRDTTQLIYEKDKSKSFGDLIKKYQDFAAKRLEIEKKFSDQLAVLQQGKKTPGADTDKIDASIKVLKQQQEIELNALDLEIANRTEVFKVWVNKITTLGLQELVGALEAAKDTLSMSDVSDEDKAVLRAKIEALQNQIKVLQAKDPSGQKDWTATLKTMNEVNESIGNIIRGFDGLDESTKSILTAATNISGAIITSISGVIALSVTGTEAIKAVERASVILAIIGAAISVITIIINLFTSAAKKRKEQEEAAIERQRQEYLGLLDYKIGRAHV